ncbi:hypothetical protein BOW51_10205 [Solemya velesiana gill symbiont]|uniref:Glycosyltransferase 2-like domain-containing protein n=2 Tax=Solemya velesiana gill symbiont TaxID=1918948 RepID=A0A1T2KSV7_9GAMM|nr:hypothetical protein BOW51_10205 [Solemya velesiana gill symbiont]
MEKKIDSQIIENLKLKAVDVIRNKLSDKSITAFKDPRTSRLLPFWKTVFDEVGCSVDYIVVLRNPLSVASSLYKRNRIEKEKSIFLWMEHVLLALLDSRGSRRIVVNYDFLLDNPKKELERISHTLDLDMPELSSPDLHEYMDEFLDVGLRHSQFQIKDLELDSQVSTDVCQLYELTLNMACDAVSIDSDEVQLELSGFKQRFQDIYPIINYVSILEERISKLFLDIGERENSVRLANETVMKSENNYLKVHENLDQSRDSNIELNDQLVQLEHKYQVVRSELELVRFSKKELQDQIEQLDQEHKSIQNELERERSINTEFQDQLEQLEHDYQDAHSELEQLRFSNTELNELLVQHTQNQQVFENDLKQTRSSNAVLQDQLERLMLDYQEVKNDLGMVNAQLARIIKSNSWYLTKPCRFLRRSLITLPFYYIRCTLSTRADWVWRHLPLSTSNKQKLKSILFSRLPLIFRNTQAYSRWYEFTNQNINGQVLENATPSDIYLNELAGSEYVPLLEEEAINNKPVKLVCFYLPQFHPIPENNKWWGDGFTEWDNVLPAQPQFYGHYQPHKPGELGYYNLLDPGVQRRQVELAKLYGIEGFCFYFYWFGGKRLLEKPIENYLNDSSLTLPFCLCWANENWSRRWDGLESDILIEQKHSSEDDLAFIKHVSNYIRDPRYIRIDGKPLLLVYRPNLLPSAMETSKRWRKWCNDNGIGEIYLAYTQSFEMVDPANYGFDAAIEFPPNNSEPPVITDSVVPVGEDFGCTVYDWQVFVNRSKEYKQPGYKLFRSVCPSWDNTARRKNISTVFLNSTPKLYQQWLENAIQDTVQHQINPDERLIFVNAWNEWAEGAHLEPDDYYGYAYLKATRDALSIGEIGSIQETRKIVLVTHDANPHGAQYLSLNLAKTLSREFGYHVDVACLGDGPLKVEYAKWATVHDLSCLDARGPQAVTLVRRLYEAGNRSAIVNTTVSGYFLETLARNGFECVALVHELRGVLEQFGLHGKASAIAEYATKVVFPSEEVAVSFEKIAPIDVSKIIIRPQGLYKRRNNSLKSVADRENLRKKLGLPEDSQIVLGVGYADYRKGIDLFVEAGLKMAQRIPQAYWIWVGHWEINIQQKIDKKLAEFPAIKERFIFPGLQSDTALFYSGADVFALTSREDPFPSVVLEALDAEVPVVGFEGAGGFVGLLRRGCGVLVPKEDVGAFADAVGNILEAPFERKSLGQRGAELINEFFSFRQYVFDLLDFVGHALKRVSIVVPNYNYANYLPERLSSIVNQKYPVFEIIFIDDCSTDNSVKLAKDILESQPIDFKIVVNTENSGSVFRQWKYGVDSVRGTHVWIAEADDSCSSNFLSEVMGGFDFSDVVLSYCESKQIDEDGKILADNYLAYVADLGASRWMYPYVNSGEKETIEALCVKNTIPNVSGVVFKKSNLKSVMNQNINLIQTYRVAGDWLVYVLMLRNGKVAFSPSPLNVHRRHEIGVTIGSFNESQLKEIERMQKFVAEEFDVPKDMSIKAKEYLVYLSDVFKLDPKKCQLKRTRIQFPSATRQSWLEGKQR